MKESLILKVIYILKKMIHPQKKIDEDEIINNNNGNNDDDIIIYINY